MCGTEAEGSDDDDDDDDGLLVQGRKMETGGKSSPGLDLAVIVPVCANVHGDSETWPSGSDAGLHLDLVPSSDHC